jgi:type I restriction enzyme S subunit
MANNIPELRFSEFAEDWIEKRLGHIGEYVGGGTPDTSVKEYWQGQIPWISSSDISDGSIHKIDKTRFITEKAIEESATKLIPKGSVLMVSRVGIGKFAIADEDLCTSQDFTSLISEENEYFLGYYFSTKANRFISLSQGTSIKGFTTKDIKSAKFSIPTKTEQTKIAKFLTAVDKRINLLQKKKAELEQYKKGIMQKLFSQTLRFKNDDGSDFEDWEEKSLGEVGNTFNGLTGKTKVDFGKGKPYIQYMQIFSNSRIDIANFGLVDVGDDDNQSIAQFGDVFFTTSSETPNEIGMSSVLTEQVEDVYLNSFCFGYRPNSLDELVPEFSQFFFRSSKVREEIIKLAQGSTRFNMSKVAFMKLKFDFPKKEEQQKIATSLSSIDKSIDNMNNQIDDSVIFKKGLLQQMFV